MAKVAVAGSFDHLHAGHQQLLAHAFSLNKEVLVGVTSARLTHHKQRPQAIQSLDDRLFEVNRFCQTLGKQYQTIVLEDAVGPSLEPEFTDIVVTPHTLAGAESINQLRQKANLTPLQIHVVDLLLCGDGKTLSSSRIRLGQTDRQGLIYASLFESSRIVPDKVKSELKNPLGPVSDFPDQAGRPWIVVGDATHAAVREKELSPDVVIIDGHIGRVSQASQDSATDIIHNSAGSINVDAVRAMMPLFETGGELRVIGEEDLLAMPAIVLAPLGSEVWYGQPDQGIVKVVVDEDIKAKLVNLVKQSDHQ